MTQYSPFVESSGDSLKILALRGQFAGGVVSLFCGITPTLVFSARLPKLPNLTPMLAQGSDYTTYNVVTNLKGICSETLVQKSARVMGSPFFDDNATLGKTVKSWHNDDNHNRSIIAKRQRIVGKAHRGAVTDNALSVGLPALGLPTIPNHPSLPCPTIHVELPNNSEAKLIRNCGPDYTWNCGPLWDLSHNFEAKVGHNGLMMQPLWVPVRWALLPIIDNGWLAPAIMLPTIEALSSFDETQFKKGSPWQAHPFSKNKADHVPWWNMIKKVPFLHRLPHVSIYVIYIACHVCDSMYFSTRVSFVASIKYVIHLATGVLQLLYHRQLREWYKIRDTLAREVLRIVHQSHVQNGCTFSTTISYKCCIKFVPHLALGVAQKLYKHWLQSLYKISAKDTRGISTKLVPTLFVAVALTIYYAVINGSTQNGKVAKICKIPTPCHSCQGQELPTPCQAERGRNLRGSPCVALHVIYVAPHVCDATHFCQRISYRTLPKSLNTLAIKYLRIPGQPTSSIVGHFGVCPTMPKLRFPTILQPWQSQKGCKLWPNPIREMWLPLLPLATMTLLSLPTMATIMAGITANTVRRYTANGRIMAGFPKLTLAGIMNHPTTGIMNHARDLFTIPKLGLLTIKWCKSAERPADLNIARLYLAIWRVNKMIPVEKIADMIQEQAKQGSCKACRFCVRLPKPIEIGAEYTWDKKPVTLTHACEIQGNMNPIEFSQRLLDSMAYPGKCDEGNWHDGDTMEDYDECFAYQPGYDGTLVDDSVRKPEAIRHSEFMRSLGEAMRLHNAIQNSDIAKLTAKLNEAKESLPAVPATQRIK